MTQYSSLKCGQEYLIEYKLATTLEVTLLDTLLETSTEWEKINAQKLKAIKNCNE